MTEQVTGYALTSGSITTSPVSSFTHGGSFMTEQDILNQVFCTTKKEKGAAYRGEEAMRLFYTYSSVSSVELDDEGEQDYDIYDIFHRVMATSPEIPHPVRSRIRKVEFLPDEESPFVFLVVQNRSDDCAWCSLDTGGVRNE